MEHWICGRLIGEWSAEGCIWEFQGVFSTESKAVEACGDETYFIFKSVLDEELPHEAFVADGRYPVIEKEL